MPQTDSGPGWFCQLLLLLHSLLQQPHLKAPQLSLELEKLLNVTRATTPCLPCIKLRQGMQPDKKGYGPTSRCALTPLPLCKPEIVIKRELPAASDPKYGSAHLHKTTDLLDESPLQFIYFFKLMDHSR